MTLPVAVLLGCAEAGVESRLAEWQVEHELTIGGAEDGPFSFSDLRSFAVGDDGTVYLLEARENEVRAFSPDGELVRAIGRRGQGPGEFERAIGVALTPDGHVWVYAPGARRLAQFTTNGEFVRSYIPPVDSWEGTWTGGMHADWRLYDLQSLRADTGRVQGIVTTDLRTERADTLPIPSCSASGIGYYDFPMGAMPIPFGTGLLMALDVAGNRVWCVDTREIRVYEYELGATARTRTLVAEVTPEPVTRADRDSAIAAVEKFKERVGGAATDYSLIPSVKAIVEGISMDDVGRVWVRARTAEGFRLIGFDREGRPIAAIVLPEAPHRWAPLVVRGDRVWYVTTDADGVPAVVRYRITGP
ncbi:MAG TPA: hypothetical protein VMK53_06745 [Gemmatimonadales bacterium]|nr:hypothetical protein [Gemmatimonadales bacterium]